MRTIRNIVGKVILLSVFAVALSCGSSKTCNDKLTNKDCPPNGKCSVIIHKNKSLVIKTSELGELQYEMQDNENKDVAVYSYVKDVPKDLQDAGYREEVVLELDRNPKKSVLSGAALQSRFKALFGRFCYCKGATGYYRIDSGSLEKPAEDQNVYSFSFKITEVPQIVQKIQFTTK